MKRKKKPNSPSWHTVLATRDTDDARVDVVRVAGLEYFDDEEGEVEGSKSFHILPDATGARALMNPAFQENEAERLYEWIKNHLPHGIALKLKRKIIEEDKNAKVENST